jgi:hypothetical protein
MKFATASAARHLTMPSVARGLGVSDPLSIVLDEKGVPDRCPFRLGDDETSD